MFFFLLKHGSIRNSTLVFYNKEAAESVDTSDIQKAEKTTGVKYFLQ